MTKAERDEQFDVIKMVAEEAVIKTANEQSFSPFGTGFVWVVAEVDNVRKRMLVGSVFSVGGWIKIKDAVLNSCVEIMACEIIAD
jgi:hypothetical protein